MALADTQWKYGLLDEETKRKALYYIEQQAFLEDFELKSERRKWLETLGKVKTKMLSLEQGKGKIKVEKPFKKNIWEIGDYYAYQFNSVKAKEAGLAGKYIVLQKVGENHYYDAGDTDMTYVRVFRKVFDDIPKIDDLKGVPLLYFVERFEVFDKKERTLEEMRHLEILKSRNNTAELYYEKEHHYKQKYYHFIGNGQLEEKFGCGSFIDLKKIDEELIFYYKKWENYKEE